MSDGTGGIGLLSFSVMSWVRSRSLPISIPVSPPGSGFRVAGLWGLGDSEGEPESPIGDGVEEEVAEKGC